MPRLGILDRQDEGLHIKIGKIGRRAPQVQAPRIGGRLRLSGGSRRGVRPKAVGVHVPQASRGGASGGQAVVKTKYVAASRSSGMSRYLQKDVPEKVTDYIGREGAGYEGHRAELFGAHGAISEEDRLAFVARAQRDPRLWHVIVSPQQADKLDMELVVRRFMEQVEADTGLRLDYIASIHRDHPSHIHSHVLIRGRDRSNQEFRFDRDFVSHGLRTRLQAIAQRHLDLGLAREQMREQVVEVAHSRVIEPNEAQKRIQEAKAKWTHAHARALAGRQTARDEGTGY